MNAIPKSGQSDAVSRGQDDDAHARLASEQSSMHAVRVSIARWRGGNTTAEGPAPDAMPQSRWHATAQHNFCAWLDAGGFRQADTTDATRPEPSCLHCE